MTHCQSRSRGSRPGSLNLQYQELELDVCGSDGKSPAESCEQLSAGKRLIRRICPRVVRKFLSRLLSRGESNSKSLQGGNLQGATNEELSGLMAKVDELLKVVGKDEPCRTPGEQECIVCVNASAVLETYPCRHRVLCKSCFLRTIQVAISQGILPLQCVLCRSEIFSLSEVQECDVLMDFSAVSETMRRVPRFSVKNAVGGGQNALGIVRTPTSESEFFMEMLRHPDEPSLLGAPPKRKPRRPTFYEKASSFSNSMPRSSNAKRGPRAGLHRRKVSPTSWQKTKSDAKNEETPEMLSPQEQFRFQFHKGRMAALKERRQMKTH